MSVETTDNMASSATTIDPPETSSENWFAGISAVKSLLTRFGGGAVNSVKECQTNTDEEQSLPARLTKLVGEASEQITTVSGGWFASLAATTRKTTKAIEDSSSSKSITTWELPSFPPMTMKQDLGSWSYIRTFWEKTLFGKETSSSDDLTAPSNETDDTDESDGDGLGIIDTDPPKEDQDLEEVAIDDTASLAKDEKEDALQSSVEKQRSAEGLDSEESGCDIDSGDKANAEDHENSFLKDSSPEADTENVTETADGEKELSVSSEAQFDPIVEGSVEVAVGDASGDQGEGEDEAKTEPEAAIESP